VSKLVLINDDTQTEEESIGQRIEERMNFLYFKSH